MSPKAGDGNSSTWKKKLSNMRESFDSHQVFFLHISVLVCFSVCMYVCTWTKSIVILVGSHRTSPELWLLTCRCSCLMETPADHNVLLICMTGIVMQTQLLMRHVNIAVASIGHFSNATHVYFCTPTYFMMNAVLAIFHWGLICFLLTATFISNAPCLAMESTLCPLFCKPTGNSFQLMMK